MTREEQEPKYCDRNICIKNEYNGIGCEDCEVTKSQVSVRDDMTEDCISREAVLELIEHSNIYSVNLMKNIVSDMPKVEAIPKADYENRLKADMVAMLTDLKNKIIDKSWNTDMYDDDLDFECCYLNDIDEVIQQKIDKLKEVEQ